MGINYSINYLGEKSHNWDAVEFIPRPPRALNFGFLSSSACSLVLQSAVKPSTLSAGFLLIAIIVVCKASWSASHDMGKQYTDHTGRRGAPVDF